MPTTTVAMLTISSASIEAPELFSKRAIEDYNKAIRLKPNFALAYGSRGMLTLTLASINGRLRIAIRLLRSNLIDSYRLYLPGGSVYRHERIYKLAIQDYDKAIELTSS